MREVNEPGPVGVGWTVMSSLVPFTPLNWYG
jgi:hypothetical protein